MRRLGPQEEDQPAVECHTEIKVLAVQGGDVQKEKEATLYLTEVEALAVLQIVEADNDELDTNNQESAPYGYWQQVLIGMPTTPAGQR